MGAGVPLRSGPKRRGVNGPELMFVAHDEATPEAFYALQVCGRCPHTFAEHGRHGCEARVVDAAGDVDRCPCAVRLAT